MNYTATAGVWRHWQSMDRAPSLAATSLLALAALARPECLMLFPLAMLDGWRGLGRLYGRHLQPVHELVLRAPSIAGGARMVAYRTIWGGLN